MFGSRSICVAQDQYRSSFVSVMAQSHAGYGNGQNVILPNEVWKDILAEYTPNDVARGLHSISKEVKQLVAERTADTIGHGKWRAFLHNDKSILLQQLHFDKRYKCLYIHSFLTNPMDAVLYERIYCVWDGGKQCADYCKGLWAHAVADKTELGNARSGLLDCKMPWNCTDNRQRLPFWRMKVLSTVGGGEGYVFTPRWRLPEWLPSSEVPDGSLFWTLEPVEGSMSLNLYLPHADAITPSLSVVLSRKIPGLLDQRSLISALSTKSDLLSSVSTYGEDTLRALPLRGELD